MHMYMYVYMYMYMYMYVHMYNMYKYTYVCVYEYPYFWSVPRHGGPLFAGSISVGMLIFLWLKIEESSKNFRYN